MLFRVGSRRLCRALPRTSVISYRVDQAPFASRCITTSCSTTDAGLRSRSMNSSFRNLTLPFHPVRNLATGRPASRPKGHTGRSTSSTRKSNAKTGTTKTTSAAKPKKTTAKAKTAKPRRVKKPITQEQKDKAKIKSLKELALKTPKQLPQTAYIVLNASMRDDLVKGEGIQSLSKKSSQRYKNLSPAEREHFNAIAQENKGKNEQAYKQWVRSHSGVDIYRANLARRHLSRLGVKGYTRRLADDRQIKRPASPQTIFVKERHGSGEMAGINVTEALKLINTEWKALPEPEKQKYVDAAAQDFTRYKSEYQQLFGKAYSPKARAAPAA